nr:hypothetical protein BaRGS_005106 [Batillaria attramentaria]
MCAKTVARQQAAEYGNMQTGSRVTVRIKSLAASWQIPLAGCVCRGKLARQQAAEYGNMQTGSRVTVRLRG